MTNVVREILINNGLEEFIPILEENNLDREILSELTEADYRKIGITGDAMDKLLGLFSPKIPSADNSENSQGKTSDNMSIASIGQVTPMEVSTSPTPISPVHNILIENDLSEYIAVFNQHKLTNFDVISKLTEDDLSELGIHAIGDRKKIKELFRINEKKAEDNNVVVTQNVATEKSNGWLVAISVIVGAIIIGIIIYYAIPWWWRY